MGLDSEIRNLALQWGAGLFGVADLSRVREAIFDWHADIAGGYRAPSPWVSS